LALRASQSAAVAQTRSSGTVNTSKPSITTSLAGPLQPWFSTTTRVPAAADVPCVGLTENPRRIQFCAERTSTLVNRGVAPPSAATVTGAAL
jgi:hypothetical protein